jgi:lysophospholipid acyltransferase (LPLAT)-like uncharacterized protein
MASLLLSLLRVNLVSQPDRPVRSSQNRFSKKAARAFITVLGPWVIALGILILRTTCRVRIHNDPRAELRAGGACYVFSVLHAHQIAAGICRERGTAAMVSQSRDGDFVAFGFRLIGIKTIRGSNRRHGQDRGGLSALNNLMEHVRTGLPAILAVDGPRGPRNRVHKGIAALSRQTGAAVLNVVTVPTRRWIFKRSWDRFQIPKPFSRIDIFVAAPLWPEQGESIEDYRRRIEQSLCELEAIADPAEAENVVAHHEYIAKKAASKASAA